MGMTNYERIKSLSKEEMAWIFLNNCTSSGFYGCDLCMYKSWEDCKEIAKEIRVSCIEGHRRWLDREPTEEDEKMYSIAKNNIVIDAHIAMDKEESVKWKVVYENGYAVRLEKVESEG